MDISLSTLSTNNICIAVRDITEQKLLAQQLQQSQKMEAVGQLTGGLAHDFNNLLMVMIGNLDIMNEVQLDSEQAGLLNSVLEAAIRGSELTRRLLAFSRRQPLKPSLTDVNKQLESTATLLRRTLGENIRLELKMAPDSLAVSVDQAQFESAVVNISINSRDAMPDGGTITIETSTVQVGEDNAEMYSGVAAGEYVAVGITDTGSGIPPELVSRVFEPFFTTKEKGKGTGLGLSMVYGFIKQSGGGLSIDSKVGKGTTIRLLLPRLAGEANNAQAKPEKEIMPECKKSHVILAVDDNPDVRSTVVRNLKAQGYRVIEAENAEEALAKLDSEKKVDLLFTDVIMPGRIDGMGLAKLARAKHPGIKVLYTSGFPGEDTTAGASSNIDAPLLQKPYRKQALMKAVMEVFEAA
jgi:nitrogen-specific signal transduction histidine kinase/ActR/RegA family two-component response regulator